MSELKRTKEVKTLLTDLGLNPDHIFRIYNDRLVKGRRFKIILAVLGGGITGEKALDQKLALKIGNTLTNLGMEEIFISQGRIEFKNRNI